MGVVRVIDKVIESAKFASGIHGVRRAFEALGFEKWKQLHSCSSMSRQSESLNPGYAARRTKEVDIALLSLANTDFVGLFRLWELDYDNFRQFCRRSGPRGSSSDSKDLFVCVPSFYSVIRVVYYLDKTKLSNWTIWIRLFGSDIWIFGFVFSKTESLFWISDWFWFIN
ncbi:unnamed protein product [Lactuca saligna]|uniref:Uncharacterized protein n=1 Tax=Lactuca saligna TaxID=75948 RepID=A0AA35YKR8_LACSI|nr:unnamed protein product [Lactuca saligna]